MTSNKSSSTLLCLTTSYPSPSALSSGHFVAHLNRAYQDFGYSVSVLSPHPHINSIYNRLKDYSTSQCNPSLQCPYYGFPQYTYSSWGQIFHSHGAPDWIQNHPIRAMTSVPPTLIALKRALKNTLSHIKPHGVIAHWLLPNGLIALPYRPLIYVHGGDLALLEKCINPLKTYLAQKLDRESAGMVFVSYDLKERFLSILKRPPTSQYWVKPMGITPPKSIQELTKIDLMNQAGGRLILTSLGRCVSIKGFDLIPKAFKLLPMECQKDLCWFLAGDGPERSTLRSMSQECGLTLFDLGEVSADTRDTLLSITTLFVFTSRILGKRQEGSPVSLGEACVSGCPIIATKTGGVQERLNALVDSSLPHFKPPFTQLIPPDSPQDLAYAILEVWVAWKKDQSRWPTLSDRLKRREAYCALTWPVIGPQHVEIIRSVFPQSQS